VEQSTNTGGPEVTSVVEGDVAALTVVGELTEAARRPIVRILTDLLLAHGPLRRIELRLGEVTFLNSAGLAVLVQVLKLAAPRKIGVALVGPTDAVLRPLQLSGLWHRFEIVDADSRHQAPPRP
jgi:anti-anti-sigma factor